MHHVKQCWRRAEDIEFLGTEFTASCELFNMVGTKLGSLQEQQVLLTVQHLSSFLVCFSNRSHIVYASLKLST